jgi:hypothetical protein
MERQFLFCEVSTEFLKVIYTNFMRQGIITCTSLSYKLFSLKHVESWNYCMRYKMRALWLCVDFIQNTCLSDKYLVTRLKKYNLVFGLCCNFCLKINKSECHL